MIKMLNKITIWTVSVQHTVVAVYKQNTQWTVLSQQAVEQRWQKHLEQSCLPDIQATTPIISIASTTSSETHNDSQKFDSTPDIFELKVKPDIDRFNNQIVCKLECLICKLLLRSTTVYLVRFLHRKSFCCFVRRDRLGMDQLFVSESHLPKHV